MEPWRDVLMQASHQGRDRMAKTYLKRFCKTDQDWSDAQDLAEELGIELY